MSGVHLDVDECARVVGVFEEVSETLGAALRRLDAQGLDTHDAWPHTRGVLASILSEHTADGRRLDRLRRAVLAADGAWPTGDAFRRHWNEATAVVAPAVAEGVWRRAGVLDTVVRAAWGPLGPWRPAADLLAGLVGGDRRPGAPEQADPADVGGTFDRRSVQPFPGTEPGPALDRGRSAVSHLLSATTGAPLTGGALPQAAADEFQLVDHGSGRFTVVLGGVIDLSRPTIGLDPDHGSVRDLDVNAFDAAFSRSPHDDRYAAVVAEAVRRAGVPIGSDLLVVGHSYGAGAAVNLASDPVFNGEDYSITHVVATGYHADPWLANVAPETEVLLLKNRRDLVVATESVADRLVIESPRRRHHRHGTIRSFDGGLGGGGHDQRHYVDFVERTHDPEVERFLVAVAHRGYARPGPTVAVDISTP